MKIDNKLIFFLNATRNNGKVYFNHGEAVKSADILDYNHHIMTMNGLPANKTLDYFNVVTSILKDQTIPLFKSTKMARAVISRFFDKHAHNNIMIMELVITPTGQVHQAYNISYDIANNIKVHCRNTNYDENTFGIDEVISLKART